MKEKLQAGIDRVQYFVRRPRTRAEGLRNLSQGLKAVVRDIASPGGIDDIEVTVEDGTQLLPGETIWVHAGRVHIRLQQKECAAFIEYGPGLHDGIRFKRRENGHRYMEFATTFAGYPFKSRLKASQEFITEIIGSLDTIIPAVDHHVSSAHSNAPLVVSQARRLYKIGA